MLVSPIELNLREVAMQNVHLVESSSLVDKRYTPRNIIVQRISLEKYGSLIAPCRHNFGIGIQGTFTCLHPDDNHAHIVLADDGMGILPACIESREYFMDVLTTLVEKKILTKEEKLQFAVNDAKRLPHQHITNAELKVKASLKDYNFATTPIYIVLDPPD